jgi:SpoVK/Ycf46/Vps4 family AAA+-type ATPase
MCVVLKKSNIFARIENSISESYILYANDGYESLNKFKEILYKFYVAPEEEKNNLYKIFQDNTCFHLNKGHIKEVKDFDIARQYNDDFPHEDEKIRKFVEDDDRSGLVILHGEKGTGKTTYIRNLITNNPNKKFVFVSPDMVQLLGQPAFTTFLNSLTNHIIILEDCENAIRDRKNSLGISASAVSVLLNMSDGLLADDLGIKFICTFNEDIKDIDSALLRKGRLVSKYEFKPLTVDKTNALLEYIYTQRAKENEENVDENTGEVVIPKVEKGLTLADIYNFEEDSYETVRKKII